MSIHCAVEPHTSDNGSLAETADLSRYAFIAIMMLSVPPEIPQNIKLLLCIDLQCMAPSSLGFGRTLLFCAVGVHGGN